MARSRLLLAFSVALLACDPSPDVGGTPLPTHVDRAAQRSADDATDDPAASKPLTPVPAAPITPLPAPTSSASPSPTASASTSTSSAPPPPPPPKPTVSAVDVHWSRKSSTAEYSFDIETTAGQLIGPCIDVGTVGQSLSVRYAGVCTSPGLEVPLTQVAKVRVCWTEGGDWSKASCAAMPYDPTEADVTIPN
jgi:hypothetical protein